MERPGHWKFYHWKHATAYGHCTAPGWILMINLGKLKSKMLLTHYQISPERESASTHQPAVLGDIFTFSYNSIIIIWTTHQTSWRKANGREEFHPRCGFQNQSLFCYRLPIVLSKGWRIIYSEGELRTSYSVLKRESSNRWGSGFIPKPHRNT